MQVGVPELRFLLRRNRPCRNELRSYKSPFGRKVVQAKQKASVKAGLLFALLCERYAGAASRGNHSSCREAYH